MERRASRQCPFLSTPLAAASRRALRAGRAVFKRAASFDKSAPRRAPPRPSLRKWDEMFRLTCISHVYARHIGKIIGRRGAYHPPCVDLARRTPNLGKCSPPLTSPHQRRPAVRKISFEEPSHPRDPVINEYLWGSVSIILRVPPSRLCPIRKKKIRNRRRRCRRANSSKCPRQGSVYLPATE